MNDLSKWGTDPNFTFKIYDLTTWLPKMAIHIWVNISRNKGNQTMKLGQLIEYNKRNIFLQKLSKK